MEQGISEIKNDIKLKNFSAVYLLMGEEEFFIDQITQVFIDNVLSKNEKEFNLNIIYGKDANVDIVLECTGIFTSKSSCSKHIEGGAKKVIISAPGKSDVDATIVFGVNHKTLDSSHKVISNASCTTNCLAPIVKVVNENFSIKHGAITTIHDVTNTQVPVDLQKGDLRRARGCIQSLIPTTTGSAKAIAEIFPELKGNLNGHAVRIPLLNASLTDAVFELNNEVTEKQVNNAFKKTSETYLKGILGYEE